MTDVKDLSKKKKGKSKVKLPAPEDIMTALANKNYNEPQVEFTETEVDDEDDLVEEIPDTPAPAVPSIGFGSAKAKSMGSMSTKGNEPDLFDPTKELPNKNEYFRDDYFVDIPQGLYRHIKGYKKVPKNKYQQVYFVYGHVTLGSSNRKDGLMASINQLGASFEELTVSKDKFVVHLQGLRKAAKSVKAKQYKFATLVRVDADRGTFTSKGKNIFSCASPSQITVDGETDLRCLNVIGSVGLKMGKSKRTVTGEIVAYMAPITSKVIYEREIIFPGMLTGVYEAFGTSV